MLRCRSTLIVALVCLLSLAARFAIAAGADALPADAAVGKGQISGSLCFQCWVSPAKVVATATEPPIIRFGLLITNISNHPVRVNTWNADERAPTLTDSDGHRVLGVVQEIDRIVQGPTVADFPQIAPGTSYVITCSAVANRDGASIDLKQYGGWYDWSYNLQPGKYQITVYYNNTLAPKSIMSADRKGSAAIDGVWVGHLSAPAVSVEIDHG